MAPYLASATLVPGGTYSDLHRSGTLTNTHKRRTTGALFPWHAARRRDSLPAP
jgi:hypothetical protein